MLAALQTGTLHAALEMNDQKILEIPISGRGLTRLSVKDDVIQDIFVYPLLIDEISVRESLQLHKSGHVFIAPDGLSQPFYITVMTQKGQVQDLKLTPTPQPGGPLILTRPAPPVDPHTATRVHHQRLEAALMAAVQGVQPPGFQSLSLEPAPEDSGDIQKHPVIAYGRQYDRINVYELENTGDREVFLTPALFLSPSDLAVVFDQPSLPAHGKIRMAILHQVKSRANTSAPHPLSLIPPHKG